MYLFLSTLICQIPNSFEVHVETCICQTHSKSHNFTANRGHTICLISAYGIT